MTEEEYDDIKNDYEQYLDGKDNIEEALSFDEFFETALHIGLYSRQLSIKKRYFDILKFEIEDIERIIEEYKLRL